ncbi:MULTISPECIES: HNH endonuclease family protein [unclassified Moraxella]|uniref:HNH endonuclease family protein n=1 Tax=unclassified Moraxella TaxID=2685852 RepID=UPI00359DF17D
MHIEHKNITIGELTQGYADNNEQGVVAYGGLLNVRPPFQREFVYNQKQRNEVIYTVLKGFPLNVMYWATTDDGQFELMDGQQRTISICQFVAGDFSIKIDGNALYFHNLNANDQKQILDYKLHIYICTGKPSDKLAWFEIINIAGEKLTDQELKNAMYTGKWLTDAKRHFSKTGCVAYQIGSDYLTGMPIRQDYLEKTLKWISQTDPKYNKDITQYMAQHQHDSDALQLWQYFQNVISWTKAKFPHYRKMMKGLEWGEFYNAHKDDILDAELLERRICELINDDEVENNKGIYAYLLKNDPKYLNLRTFSDKDRQKAYQAQKGICKICNEYFTIDDMEADHIIPWAKGGKTTFDNCQMLCQKCNRTKSGK